MVGINTNGALLGEFADFLKDYPPYAIEVSLYGYDQKTYKQFTGNFRAFNAVDKSLKKCKEYNFNLSLKGIITNSNYEYFNKIRHYAKSLGFMFRSDYIVFPQVDGNNTVNNEQINNTKILSYLKNQIDAESYCLNLFNRVVSTEKRIFKCKKQVNSIFINSKLNVSICVCSQNLTCKYELGKLNKCMNKLNEIIQMPASRDNKCMQCKFINICRYCPARFYLENKSYEHPPKWCCELTQDIYNNFISGFRVIKKTFFTDKELNELCEIESENMKSLGLSITEQDKILWKQNMQKNLNDDNFLCFVGYLDGKICAFVTFFISNKQIWVSEFELNKSVQNTKIIYKIIKFLCNIQNFGEFDSLFFKINKTNQKSKRTFSHLGAIIQKENEKSFTYVLKKEELIKFITLLEKRKSDRTYK